MDVSSLLLETFGRIPPLAFSAVDGLDQVALRWQPAEGRNPIGWLVWHLARVQDSHVAEVLSTEQIWETGTWAASFELAPDPSNTGYGHSPADVLSVRPADAGVLLGYLRSVDERTTTMLRDLDSGQLDRVVDRNWDPPVTLGVRLVSIADDCLQHAGQAAYVRGLLG